MIEYAWIYPSKDGQFLVCCVKITTLSLKKENIAYRSQIWIIKKTRIKKNMLNNGDCP